MFATITRLASALLIASIAWLWAAAPAALASQGNCVMPTTGSFSGLTYAQDNNICFEALLTHNSGTAAPANGTGGVAMLGQAWLKTTDNSLNIYDGASWLRLGTLDTTNHYWQAVIGGGVATIASGTTTDLWSSAASGITISGTTTITALANSSAVPGTIKTVRFSGALTLTYNATSLILPGALSITTVAGDSMVVQALTSSNVVVISYNRAAGTALSSTSVGASSFLSSAAAFSVPVNLKISASTSASALTVAIKGNDGNDPSSSNPVLAPFQSITSSNANGAPIVRTLTAALSITVASTNTLGSVNGVPFRVWVTLFDNGGTVLVCVFNASSSAGIFALNEAGVASSAGSTTGGNSAGTHYCNAASASNRAFRVIGYLDFDAGEATAGTWANSTISRVVLFGPGVRLPGAVVQTVYSTTTTTQAVSNTTKVATALTGSITLSSPVNPVRVQAAGWISNPSNTNGRGVVATLYRQTGTVAVGNSVIAGANSSNTFTSPIVNFALDAPAASNWPATQYGLYIAGTSTDTFTFLGTSNGAGIGQGAVMTIEEIQG